MQLSTTNVALLIALLVLGTNGMRHKEEYQESANLQPCCSPSQFETSVKVVTSHDVSRMNVRFSFDYINQLMVENQTIQWPNGQVSYQQMLGNGSSQKAYIFDLATKKCFVQYFSKFPLMCVPSMYTYAATVVLGEPNHSVNGLVFDLIHGNYTEQMTMSQTFCAPISMTSTGPDAFNFVGFYNFTIGIKDRSVFTIPKECKTAEKDSVILRSPRSIKSTVGYLDRFFFGLTASKMEQDVEQQSH